MRRTRRRETEEIKHRQSKTRQGRKEGKEKKRGKSNYATRAVPLNQKIW